MYLCRIRSGVSTLLWLIPATDIMIMHLHYHVKVLFHNVGRNTIYFAMGFPESFYSSSRANWAIGATTRCGPYTTVAMCANRILLSCHIIMIKHLHYDCQQASVMTVTGLELARHNVVRCTHGSNAQTRNPRATYRAYGDPHQVGRTALGPRVHRANEQGGVKSRHELLHMRESRSLSRTI